MKMNLTWQELGALLECQRTHPPAALEKANARIAMLEAEIAELKATNETVSRANLEYIRNSGLGKMDCSQPEKVYGVWSGYTWLTNSAGEICTSPCPQAMHAQKNKLASTSCWNVREIGEDGRPVEATR